ncbi:LTA synthase family protein [Halobacillus salinarum]|uniref:LTA synthase family protein n=1 Tax=Halobacillus salinarum TaxID=2932257 RepID=A0ABY4EFY8_9BACI|nr:LTA synthase family protein [Halobacillus salinarum]UOQ42524.1 LTA synthase family protein [Halobacillus salinarum]
MQLNNRKTPLFIIATILFGIKTYIVYRFMFDLSIDNPLQEFILLINPIASAYLVFAISVWFQPRKQRKFLRWAALTGTLIIYFNLLFYRNFTDFITIPVLFQGNNAADLSSSISTLIHWPDLLLFLDVLVIWYLSKPSFNMHVEFSKSSKLAATAVTFLLLAGNVTLAEMERPMLFVRTFDREYLVKNIGLFNYHIYDSTMQTKTKAQRVFADGSEISEVEGYMDKDVQPDKKSELFGAAKGRNVIFISLESFQNFVLDSKINGKETTPFLNDLKESSDTFWFKNFYHQTAQGKTSDSEFLIENSMYPLGRGAVYFTNAQNEYHSLPEMLNENDYYTSVFHANNRSFWNRDVMYDNIGYDHFYDENAFEETPQNKIGWGLEDKAFFNQSIPYLKKLDQPFYSKFITLTNHFPFEMPQNQAHVDKFDSGSETLNQYFQTVRYTDEAVESFFNKLKREGLYENSIIILMGDHYGISEFHNKAMGKFLGKEVNGYEHVQLQRVPFMIHIPGYDKGEVQENIAGQIDVKPTLLHLLGIENKGDLGFGQDLFRKDRKGFIALRDGSVVGDQYVYTDSQCFDRKTGKLVSDDQEDQCKPLTEKANKELDYSDSIIYGDLLRFYEFNQIDNNG